MKAHKYMQATSLFALTITAFQLIQPSPCAAARHSVQRKSTPAPASVPTNFMRLKKSDSLWVVLEDPEVRQGMKDIMGTAVEKYFDATQITELPDVRDNELYSIGGVRGLYTIRESFFNVNLATRKLCVIVLNDNDLSIYGVPSFDRLPQPARDYIDDLQSRRVDPSEKLNIQFLKPEAAPQVSAREPQPKKNLKLGVVTGCYTRVDTNPRFESADFKVARLPGDKIKFCCTALSGSHSGQASAVVPIVNNTAEYSLDFEKGAGYKLSMQFDGKYVYVSQEGEGFGGIGVNASGTYRKVDDTVPQINVN
jgi:hypothetical protein